MRTKVLSYSGADSARAHVRACAQDHTHSDGLAN